MSDIRQSGDDDFDFIELFGMLWKGKWVILLTSAFFLFLGTAYSMTGSKFYLMSTPIKPANDSVFIDLMPVTAFKKELVVLLRLDESKSIDIALIGGKSVFDIFVSQFNDYQEMVEVIKDNASASASPEDLSSKKDERQYVALARNFKLIQPPKADGQWIASFKWHDAQEGKDLFNRGVMMALENTKAQILDDLLSTSYQITEAKQTQMEKLQIRSNVLLDTVKADKANRIAFLRQQSSIAKELGIVIDKLEDGQAAGAQYLVGSERKEYLRGFKAIDKEIELIELQTDKELMRKSNEYAEISSNIKTLEADTTTDRITDFVNFLKQKSVENWIDVNIEVAETTPNSNPAIIAIISAVMGLITGIVALVVAREVRKSKLWLKFNQGPVHQV